MIQTALFGFNIFHFIVGTATQLVILPPYIGLGGGVLLSVLLASSLLISMGRVRTDHLLFSQTHDYREYSFQRR